MAKPKRTKKQRELDLPYIARLYLKGKSQIEIADTLADERPYSLSQRQISYDLKAIQGKWLESALIDFGDARARELARIDTLEQEYWEAWVRSQEQTEKKNTSVSGDKKGVEINRENRDGNPQFLSGVQWCIEQRCKIFGLYEPERFAIDWRQEAKESGIDAGALFERMVNEMVDAIEGGGKTTTG